MSTDEGSIKTPIKLIIIIQVFVAVMITVTVAFSYLGAFPFGDEGIYRVLPGDILLDFIWLYVFAIVIGVIVYIAAPRLATIFWKLHRIITGNSYNYHVQEMDLKTTSSFSTRRMLMPAFVALGISFSISNVQHSVDMLIVTESFGTLAPEAQSIVISISLLFILLLISGIIVLIFAPMWLMQDVGLVCERKRKPRTTTDIDGVGNWYLKLLKGFAGVSTIVAYIFTIYQTIEWYQFVLLSPPEGGFSLVIFLIPLVAVVVSPFLALGPISFVYLLYEKSLKRNTSAVRSIVERNELSVVVVDIKGPT